MEGDLKNKLGACILSYIQHTGQHLKYQNQVNTWSLEEVPNCPPPRCWERRRVCALLGKQIFLIIQKFKCVGVCIFVQINSC